MAKVLFFGYYMPGRVNPSLPIVQELAKRGNQVIYYLPSEFKSSVEEHGATFRLCEPHDRKQRKDPLKFFLSVPVSLSQDCLDIISQILDEVRSEQADCIVYDGMAPWGGLLAQICGIPAVKYRPNFAENEHYSIFASRVASFFPEKSENMEQFRQNVERLHSRYGVPPFTMKEMFTRPEPLNILSIPRSLQPASDTFDERFLFVGHSVGPRKPLTSFPLEILRELQEKQVLYISVGSIFKNRLDFFRTCLAAFAEQPCRVILSTGKDIDIDQLGSLPENFLVFPRVPQLDILQHASVMIAHGGINSVIESLYYAVPLLLVPQTPERVAIADRVVELGLGVSLEQEAVTPTALQKAFLHILHDTTYRERAKNIQKEIVEAGGYKRAADAIMQFIGRS